MAEEELRFRAVGTDAGAGRMMAWLAKATGGADAEVNKLNKDLAKYDAQISETEKHLKGLVAEFAKTGDMALFKDVRRDRAKLSMLSYLRKQIAGEVGAGAGTGMLAALAKLPAMVSGSGMAIGAAVAAAAAPFLGSVIGAAVIGGVGLGGIVGGIAAASQDPRVKTAGTHLSESLTSSLGQVGEAFIVPLLEQMPRLEIIGASAFATWGDELAPLADHLDNLVDGIAGFAANLDFDKAVEAAGPLLDIIGDELPGVAESLTEALDSISEEGDGLAVGLKNLFDVVEGGIETTGSVIGFLAGVEEGVIDLGSAVNEMSEEFLDSPLAYLFPYLIPLASNLDSATDAADGYTEATIRAKGPTDDFGDGLGDAARNAGDLTEELNTLNGAFSAYFGQIMGLREATLAYKQGIRETYDALREGRPTLNENDELGQRHLDALNEQIRRIEKVREEEVARTGDLDAANAHYAAHIKTLKDTALQLGYSKTAVDKYFEALENIPEVVKTRLILETIGGGFKRVESDAGGRAQGGPVMAGRTYMVGEHGPEPVTFAENGRVLSPAQSAGLLSGASGGATAVPTAITVALVAKQSESAVMTALVQAMIPYLQVEVIGQGGVAQDVLGRIGG